MKSFPLPFCIANTTLIIVETRQAAYSENKQHKIDSPSQSIKTGNGQNKTRRAISIFLHTLRIWLHISLGVLACLLTPSHSHTHTHHSLSFSRQFFSYVTMRKHSPYFTTTRERVLCRRRRRRKNAHYIVGVVVLLFDCVYSISLFAIQKKNESQLVHPLLFCLQKYTSSAPTLVLSFTLHCAVNA